MIRLNVIGINHRQFYQRALKIVAFATGYFEHLYETAMRLYAADFAR